MAVPYSSVAVANTFIGLFARNVGGIEHMKLQKLVYCSYGWWLAHHGVRAERLTSDRPEVWRHGPVFPSLYHAFKIFGRKPILEKQALNPFLDPEEIDQDDEGALRLVRWVWARYGHLSSFALSDLTHRPKSPWHRVAVANDFSVPMSTQIPDEYILDEFVSILDDELDQVPSDPVNPGTQTMGAGG